MAAPKMQADEFRRPARPVASVRLANGDALEFHATSAGVELRAGKVAICDLERGAGALAVLVPAAEVAQLSEAVSKAACEVTWASVRPADELPAAGSCGDDLNDSEPTVGVIPTVALTDLDRALAELRDACAHGEAVDVWEAAGRLNYEQGRAGPLADGLAGEVAAVLARAFAALRH